jgi:hypothetical protein
MKTTIDHAKREQFVNRITAAIITAVLAGFVLGVILILKYATVVTLA